MNEKPLERLNYYNGQRLEAEDLKTEQEYHIRVRRWINRSLYKPGIASGLAVRAEADAPRVVVSPGMALDAEGREIILLEEARVDVPLVAAAHHGNPDGLYLTIQYREQTVAEELDGCTIVGNGRKHTGSRPAWRGPERLRANPILGWSDSIPHESSGKIILARVLLDAGCTKVETVVTDVRRYVGDASASKVHQYALEGVRDIDHKNAARIYFHIRGRQPNAVTLYLRAEKFSELYYTELGNHNHKLDVKQDVPTTLPIYNPISIAQDKYKHDHPLGTTTQTKLGDGDHGGIHKLEVAFAGRHSNEKQGSLRVETEFMVVPYGSGAITTVPAIPVTPIPLIRGQLVYGDILPVFDDAAAPGGAFKAKISGGGHQHGFDKQAKTDPIQPFDDHTHTVSPKVGIDPVGVGDLSARSGPSEKALTFVDDLQVSIGKNNNQPINHTAAIRVQIQNSHPDEVWTKLGDGGGGHPLAVNGTGEIKLDFLPNLDFDEGEYFIELSVSDQKADGNKNGGRILYNLYVE